MTADDIMIMEFLCHTARISPDPSTQNAAVCYDPVKGEIVRPTLAVNAFPLGVDNHIESRWNRPEKYARVDHAESGSIHAAARYGVKTEGLWLYCPWAACGPCASAMINGGITRLITLAPDPEATHDRWDDTVKIAYDMFAEVGLDVKYVMGPVTEEGFTILRNGQPFRP